MNISNLDLTAPSAVQDPYPIYRQLLASAPIHENASIGGWFVPRYKDVLAAFRDPRLSAERLTPLAKQLPSEDLRRLDLVFRVLSKWTLNMDPPEHTRIRDMTNNASILRAEKEMRRRAEAYANELIDAVQARGEMEIVRDFAAKLSPAVISDILGIPREDFERLRAMTNSIFRLFGAKSFGDEMISNAAAGMAGLSDYFRSVEAARRAKPEHDVVTHLVQMKGGPGGLSDDEVLGELTLLLVGGYETTRPAITSSMLLLLQHPDELRALREDRSLVRSAVEEILRYEPPFQRVARMAAEDLEMGGQQIRKGDLVWLGIAAANRDPSQFEDPDRFDVRRAPNRHLSLGVGTHFCEGAAMARLIMEVAISTLIERLPNLRLAASPGDLEWLSGTNTRALLSLPVAF